MIALTIKHSIAFFYLLAGSVSDIKTREVADWANYGLISLAIAANLIFSIYFRDWDYILNSLLGFGIFFVLAVMFFYSGQWGGGDSKMLMGIGALYGFGLKWQDNEFMVSFLLNTLIAGAGYGIIWSIAAAFRNKKKFIREFKKIVKNDKVRKIRILGVVFLALTALLLFAFMSFLSLALFSLAVMGFLSIYLWLLIKAVENSSMYKLVKPAELTEGDWIAKEVKYNGKVITGPQDLGIDKKKIGRLKRLYRQKKIKKILIKEGIPFVPSFLVGWVMTLLIGNIIGIII
ncbi:hypothetical protein GF323_03870 [Candidatus Woesearchaeota archaeon]|nr:hypothetical protein [Candidatus Woesearchaeota archaeon]